MGRSGGHAIWRSKLLSRYPYGPRIGFSSRRNGDRIVSAVWTESGNSRFAGYIEREGRLEDHRIIEGVRAAVAFLEGDGLIAAGAAPPDFRTASPCIGSAFRPFSDRAGDPT